MEKTFFDNIITLIFGKIKVAKKEFYGAKKKKIKKIKIWYVDVDNVIISKLIETKTN